MTGKKKSIFIALAVLMLSITVAGAAYFITQQQDFRGEACQRDITGACNSSCCASNSDCPSGQTCTISNGYCQSGKSCNDSGTDEQHKACVNNQCVNVGGSGDDQCSSHADCESSGSGCSMDCSTVTDESTCWTHGESGCAWIDRQCVCNPDTKQPGVTISGNCDEFEVIGGTVRLAVANCVDEYYPDETKEQCRADSNEGVGCPAITREFGPGVHSLSTSAQCGIYQIDAHGNGWQCAKTGCRWDDEICSEPTPPPLNCSNLTLTPSNPVLGLPVTAEAQTNNGTLEYLFGQLNEGQNRCTDSGVSCTVGNSFTPNQVGTYIFEVNTYAPDCEWLCSPDGQLYENTGNGCSQPVWGDVVGSCESDCLQTFTIQENFPSLRCDSIGSSGSEFGLGETITFNPSYSVGANEIIYGAYGGGTRVVDFPIKLGDVGRSYQLNEPGDYIFELNVYSEDCNYLCSPGGRLYRNTNIDAGCDSVNWEDVGGCDSDQNCLQRVNVSSPELTCDALTISETEVFVNETVTFTRDFNAGSSILYAGMGAGRVADAQQIQVIGDNNSFTPTQLGDYVFELNVYTDDCNYLCTPGGTLYRNTGSGCNSTSWEGVGGCDSSEVCLKRLTVISQPEEEICECSYVALLNSDMQTITVNEARDFVAGDQIYFAVTYTNTTDRSPVAKIRIKEGSRDFGSWITIAMDDTSAQERFLYPYTIPQGVYNFRVEAIVYLE